MTKTQTMTQTTTHAVPTAERTLVLVKPDGVRRCLAGEVLRRIEAKGYTLAAVELVTATPELLEQHYAEHVGKPFYPALVEFMLSGPILAIVAEGNRVIEGFRSLAGRPTRPRRHRAPSAATSPAPGTRRSSRTSCTARTARGRRPARSRSGSRRSDLRSGGQARVPGTAASRR